MSTPLATLLYRNPPRRAGLAESELLSENLPLVERAIAFTARRYRFSPDTADEFKSFVMEKLVERDVMRSYEGRGLTTFISVVVQRLALDYRISEWGKWHASAEAKRLGDLAVELEVITRRDGRSLDEAFAILRPRHEGVTRESLAELADRLPPRAPRPSAVPIEEAGVVADRRATPDETLLASERHASSERISAVIADLFATIPADERLIFQLRFESGMRVADIARALRIDQKRLYRIIERRLAHLRAEAQRRGISAAEVADLIGRDETVFHFTLGNPPPRPSMQDAEVAEEPEHRR